MDGAEDFEIFSIKKNLLNLYFIIFYLRHSAMRENENQSPKQYQRAAAATNKSNRCVQMELNAEQKWQHITPRASLEHKCAHRQFHLEL